MATWGKHKQCTCEVKHVAAVLEWAAKGYGGINVLGPEQRAELAAAVQKTACDLARKELTCMTCSIGADIAGVDAEVRSLRTDLESAKEDLQCGRWLQCNVTTKSRGRSRLWPNRLQKNEEAGYGQADCR